MTRTTILAIALGIAAPFALSVAPATAITLDPLIQATAATTHVVDVAKRKRARRAARHTRAAKMGPGQKMLGGKCMQDLGYGRMEPCSGMRTGM